MTLPKQIKVGGLTITVREVEGLIVDYDRFGEFSPRELQIRVESHLSWDRKELTLLHEIIEAVTTLNEIEMEHSDLTTLAHELYQVLVDNNLTWGDNK